VVKAIDRRQPAEAAHWYHGVTLRTLNDLARIRFCPDRFDFGPRYLDRDLPPRWRERIERLSFAADLDDLARKHAEACAHVEELLRELDPASDV